MNAVAVTADGQRAVSAVEDGMLGVWNLTTGQALAHFTLEAEGMCCAVTPDGSTIIAGNRSGQVHFLRLEQP